MQGSPILNWAPLAKKAFQRKPASRVLELIIHEQAILAQIRAFEDEIYRINQPAAYAYSLEMSMNKAIEALKSGMSPLAT